MIPELGFIESYPFPMLFEKRWAAWTVFWHAFCILLVGTSLGEAANLRVEPVLVEVVAPSAAATLTLRNDGDGEVPVQIRVFKWTQVNGAESLVPTTDVVASPPVTTLAPKGDYVARIVRHSGRRLEGEESYRILVDELPLLRGGRPGQHVNVLIRQSLPVFFNTGSDTVAKVAWSVRRDGNQIRVMAQNNGDRRVRISALRLRDGAGRVLSFGTGLIGYVLSRSSMSWSAPEHSAPGFGGNGPVQLDLQTDKGPIHEVVQISSGH